MLDAAAAGMRASGAIAVAGLIMRLAVHEFIEMRNLEAEQLRAQLDLPGSCEPSMAALRTSGHGKVTVVVSCLDEEGEEPDEPNT